ncbi:hypothetical protein VNI00_017430 [Paramarasmius palmivorus]|uniref:Uncharacterized protein n=1 Tax=Paramarasmius palmivorus TaxID=297713 RepID=A0AAW0B5E2_9AGAR
MGYQRAHGDMDLFIKVSLSAFSKYGLGRLFDTPHATHIHGLEVLSASKFLETAGNGKLASLLRTQSIFVRGSLLSSEPSNCNSHVDAINSCFRREVDPGASLPKQGFPDLAANGEVRYLGVIDILDSPESCYGICFAHAECTALDSVARILSADSFSLTQIPSSEPGPCAKGTSGGTGVDWHFVATARVSYDMGVAPHGFNTELYVVRGAVLIFFEGRGGDLSAVDYEVRSLGSFSGRLTDADTVCGLLMMSGDRFILRSGIPCMVVTLEPSVLSGSYFYSTSTMDYSLWCSFHTFFRPTSVGHNPVPCVAAIQYQMLLYWHSVFAQPPENLLSNPRGDVFWRHVPDITRIDGLVQLFSLFVAVNLGALMDGPRYIGSDVADNTYGFLRKSQALEADIIRNLESCVSITAMDRKTTVKLTDLWDSFFVQQNVDSVLSFLAQDLDNRQPVFEAVDTVRRGGSYVFGEELELSLHASQCYTMEWCLYRHLSSSYMIELRYCSNQSDGI